MSFCDLHTSLVHTSMVYVVNTLHLHLKKKRIYPFARLDKRFFALNCSIKSKLTRNRNAEYIFPQHLFPVAMISIICLRVHLHFAPYTLLLGSFFSKQQHYFRSYSRHCTKFACTSCGPTKGLFHTIIVFDMASFTYSRNIVRKNE